MSRDKTGASVLRRVTGMGIAGSLALALLAGGCVLAATAGPRQAQATGTRALQQTMDEVPPLDRDHRGLKQLGCDQRHHRWPGSTYPANLTGPTLTTPPPSCAATSAPARCAWPRGRRTGWA